jgi:hypothetical protein
MKKRKKSELNSRDRYEATAKIPCKKITDADRKKAIVFILFLVVGLPVLGLISKLIFGF